MVPAKRVFQTGTFDVKNYGDLLFPLIAAFRLKPRNIDIVPISPTGAAAGWRDTVQPSGFAEMLQNGDRIDGVLIGGGNIIVAGSVALHDYIVAGISDRAYPALWFGATLAAAIRNIPVVWNAPGVPASLSARIKTAGATAALKAADWLSVRDQASATNLGKTVESCMVVPDTVADLARMWPRSFLEPDFRALVERKNASPDARFAVIHVKQRSLDSDHATIAAAIDEFARNHGLTPILVAIGPCHDDHLIARKISDQLRILHILLDDPIGLREIAAAIAYAALYVGASLHGYITSAAYDVPGVIVARPLLAKFAGFLSHIDRPHDLASDWRAGLALGAAALHAPRTQRIPDTVFAALDAHWDRVGATFANPAQRMAERTRFLRNYVGWSARMRGEAWLFEPLTV